MTKHVVLGGNGAAGRETVAALQAAGQAVSSVGRTPSTLRGVDSITADLMDAEATLRALDGADVAYLTVGLPYSARVWRRDWPGILQNVIDACLANGTHLVYLDNVYVYGRNTNPMTEATPIQPASKKGEVRASLLRMLGSASAERHLVYTVGRSADFYGPGAATSAFNQFVIDRVAAGKDPTWLFDATQPHSMTYTPDLGAAMAVLGTDERARGRTWHLPAATALTGDAYMTIASDSLRHRTMSTATMRMGAPFVLAARETLEMAYQYTAPYRFDSSAFETTFGLMPTPYADGIAAALAHRIDSPTTKAPTM